MASLHDYLVSSALRHPHRASVQEATAAAISYADLDRLSDRVRDRLAGLGVGPGDRVGLCLPKSIDAVAATFGVLKRGAAYVPVDAASPAERCAYILQDCDVKAVVVEARLRAPLVAELSRAGACPSILDLDAVGGGHALSASLASADEADPAPAVPNHEPAPDDLAYILYTSGSTGKPKGVMLSQRNATSFVEWCSAAFRPGADDRFSSHAPFHFDLSILDLYVPIKHGAGLVLIPEEIGREPRKLAQLIADAGISVWYSAPSILSMMAQHGKLGDHDYSALRQVLFAGEVFPVPHLRSLVEQLPHPEYFNLYGPTETNVCTYQPIPSPIPGDRSEPFPIGRVCAQLEALVIDTDGQKVQVGSEGELCIRGPNVTQGYWNLPDQTARAFLNSGDGDPWYHTGDLVVEQPNGAFQYVGRRDRMVKRRGYRIELGEIEACLYRHSEVSEAAVIALHHDLEGPQLRAHLATRDGQRLSIIDLKRFCKGHLPSYMVPDRFLFHEKIPKTSTDKVDYQALEKLD